MKCCNMCLGEGALCMHGVVSLSATLSWPRGKSKRSYNTAVLPKNPMFHFLFVFGSFLRFRRRVWFTVAIFASFFISFLVHFYCQPKTVGSKNEPKMKSKMRQKRPKSATVSTPNEAYLAIYLPSRYWQNYPNLLCRVV